MLLEFFKGFEVVYIFFATLFFSLSFFIGKRSNLAKIWETVYCIVEQYDRNEE